jgi:hypothetical protein
MRVFTSDRAVNFVDDNDVFVGYELEQDCCEVFGWDINPALNADELLNYIFDTTKSPVIKEPADGSYEEIHSVEFTLIEHRLAEERPKKTITLTLSNEHNGYYSHGWTMGNLITIDEGMI